jgi:lysophospholipase L1-like esterase
VIRRATPTTASSTSARRRAIRAIRKKLLEKYDSCDYLHPSDAGYKAMGDAIDLSLFKSGPATTSSR